MLESSRLIKKLGTLNHSKRSKRRKKRTDAVGHHIAETQNYGIPQSTYLMNNGNRLGNGGRNLVNIDSSFNMLTHSNMEDVQTKMGMELHSGHLKSE